MTGLLRLFFWTVLIIGAGGCLVAGMGLLIKGGTLSEPEPLIVQHRVPLPGEGMLRGNDMTGTSGLPALPGVQMQ